MPKTQHGDDKKHGDKLHSLVERTGGRSSPSKREASEEDEPVLARDEDDVDPALFQDEDDEDVQNDDLDTRRDVEPD